MHAGNPHIRTNLVFCLAIYAPLECLTDRMCKPDIKGSLAIANLKCQLVLAFFCWSSLNVKAALGMATKYCSDEFLDYQNSMSYQRIVPEFVCRIKERSFLRINAVQQLSCSLDDIALGALLLFETRNNLYISVSAWVVNSTSHRYKLQGSLLVWYKPFNRRVLLRSIQKAWQVGMTNKWLC